jgi:hypothetical protein
LINECSNSYFLQQEIQNVEVFLQSSEYLMPQFLTYAAPAYHPLTDLRLDCGPIQQTLKLLHSDAPPPPWIYFAKNFVNTVEVDFWKTSK